MKIKNLKNFSTRARVYQNKYWQFPKGIGSNWFCLTSWTLYNVADRLIGNDSTEQERFLLLFMEVSV